jgi:hypothetical protein
MYSPLSRACSVRPPQGPCTGKVRCCRTYSFFRFVPVSSSSLAQSAGLEHLDCGKPSQGTICKDVSHPVLYKPRNATMKASASFSSSQTHPLVEDRDITYPYHLPLHCSKSFLPSMAAVNRTTLYPGGILPHREHTEIEEEVPYVHCSLTKF